MISLTCTSCKRVLEIDDAFAGGVCRCQFCGTIRTVPAGLKQGSRPGAPVSGATEAKTLYQKKGRAASGSQPGPGSGLDDLADAVASSSGLARGALRARAAVPTPPPPPKRDWRKLLLPLVGALVVVIIVLVVLLLR